MLVIGLDLSTKPGWALLKSNTVGIPEIVDKGTIRYDTKITQGNYPYNYIQFAWQVAQDLEQTIRLKEMVHGKVDKIIIEETTGSSQNYSQKALEFIHFAFLEYMARNGADRIVYVRDGVWKRKLGAYLSAEEKRNNARIRYHKKKQGKKSIRKINGEAVRKVTKHDAYIRCANNLYNLNLERKDEDTAAAICIATAYIYGVPLCDGTTDGGLND